LPTATPIRPVPRSVNAYVWRRPMRTPIYRSFKLYKEIPLKSGNFGLVIDAEYPNALRGHFTANGDPASRTRYRVTGSDLVDLPGRFLQ
jgi:hypothetical protein